MNSVGRRPPAVVLLFLVLIALCAGDVWGNDIPWYPTKPGTLRVVVELACDTPDDQVKRRDEALASVHTQLGELTRQRLHMLEAGDVSPSQQFGNLAAAQGTRAVDYLTAMREAHARSKGAEAASQREWMSRHLTAAKKYATLAAQALEAEAKADEASAARLKAEAFSVRRGPDRAAAFAERLKREGLSAEHRDLLRKDGLTEQDIASFHEMLLVASPEDLGISIVELYELLAEERRQMAAALANAATVHVPTEPLSNTFTVGNPHDKAEAVDLFIRPMAMPPGWKLSVVDFSASPMDPAPKSAEQPKKRVQEVVPGKHYRVILPAKGEIQVTSIAVPVGEVGMNTSARWAVEGKIGSEVIGGMVLEMHAPGIVPDLQLPPIGATAATAPRGGVARSWWKMSTTYFVLAVTSLLLAGTILIAFWRRSSNRA